MNMVNSVGINQEYTTAIVHIIQFPGAPEALKKRITRTIKRHINAHRKLIFKFLPPHL